MLSGWVWRSPEWVMGSGGEERVLSGYLSTAANHNQRHGQTDDLSLAALNRDLDGGSGTAVIHAQEMFRLC